MGGYGSRIYGKQEECPSVRWKGIVGGRVWVCVGGRDSGGGGRKGMEDLCTDVLQ